MALLEAENTDQGGDYFDRRAGRSVSGYHVRNHGFGSGARAALANGTRSRISAGLLPRLAGRRNRPGRGYGGSRRRYVRPLIPGHWAGPTSVAPGSGFLHHDYAGHRLAVGPAASRPRKRGADGTHG